MSTVFHIKPKTRDVTGRHLPKAAETAAKILRTRFGAEVDIAYAGSSTGTQQVAFNDVLRFSFHLIAFPWRGIVEPYIGVGAGIMYAVSPVALNTSGYTPAELATLYDTVDDLTSTGFASLVGGLQIKGGPFMIFGQYQINTAPSRGNAFVGSTQTASVGLRLLLGSSRDYNMDNR